MQMLRSPSACKPSFCVRRFPQVRPRGQSFEAAGLFEDWRRGRCAGGRRQVAGPGAADADGRQPSPETAKADYTLRIAPVTVELAPDHILSTIGYNDTSPGSAAADARRQADFRGRHQRYGCTRVGALAWHVDSLGRRWRGRAGHACGARAWPPPLSVYAASGGISLVPFARHGRWRICIVEAIPDNSASSTWMGKRPGAIRSGNLSLPARLGALFHQQHGRR